MGRRSLWESARMSFRSIAGSPVRSGLTALGVMIGVASVISLVALGRGAQQEVAGNLQQLGSNLLMVYSGEPRGTALVRTNTSNIRPTLTQTDLEAIRDAGPDLVNLAAPASTSNAQLQFENRNAAVTVTGTTPEYPEIRNFRPVYGAFFDQSHVDARSSVVAIGMQVYRELFDAGTDPIGRTIRINGASFVVTAVMEEKGTAAQDNSVLIPISTYQRRISGDSAYAMIAVQAADSSVMRDLQAVIEENLLRLHRMPSMDGADFYVVNQLDLLATVEGVAGTFTLMLASIAGISLIVGGIGIMNIMLVSVTERTREIGVRMALGARRRDITVQFLTEAVLIAVAGGIIGIAIGIAGSWAAFRFARIASEVTITSVLMAFGFSLLVGLFFGGYPAWRASRLNPIEALRYE
ncbi:MAG: FtsX-like permease family protein [Spirochaetaceae bacterium]|nr:MAG: FtsX-like permease family protein [Spirochaetaceae bacterium]